MQDILLREDVIGLLRDAVGDNAKLWSEANGVSRQYVSLVLNGRVEAGPLILNALGLEKVVIYRPKRKPCPE